MSLLAYLHLAEAYEASGDLEQVEATIDRAVRTGPDDWLTYYRIGRFYFVERHDPERAAGYFERVIQLLPESSIGYSGLGSCFFYLGDRKEAREQLGRAVAIGSDYEAFANLATLEFYEKRFAEAAELYERALEMDDSDYTVWSGLAEARRFDGSAPRKTREAYQQAADRLSHRLDADADNLHLLIHMASIHTQLGERTEAQNILDRLPLEEIAAPNTMFALAEVSEALGKRTDALAWIELALQAGYPLDVIEDYAAFDALCADPRFSLLAETYAEPRSDDSAEISGEGEN